MQPYDVGAHARWELCMDVLGYEVMQGISSMGYICFLAASRIVRLIPGVLSMWTSLLQSGQSRD